ALAEPLVAGERRPRALGDAVTVLAGEQPGRERAPDRGAVGEVLENPAILALDARALEQVVLGLLGDRLVEVVALGDLDGGADLVGGPLAGPPVERLARGDDVVHRP